LKQITVLLADDHAIVREGLRALLNTDGQLRIVGEAGMGREAVEMTQALQPDVILMDIAMPVLNGLEATRQILAANPAAKVLILSAHSDDDYVARAWAAGASGFLEKLTSAEILIEAIHEVAQGRVFLSRAVAKRLRDMQNQPRGRNGVARPSAKRLTSREAEVLQLVAEGSATKQIAAELSISIKTVEKHRQCLMDKLAIHNIAGLTRYAIANGVIANSTQLTVV
jgi:DNA-binding NarL/FixJ family response regulator